MRVGRLPLAALAATLALYRDPARALREIPVLAMLAAAPADLARRADALARATDGGVVAAVARVGGGALPLLELPGPAVSLPDDPEPLARALRLGDPAVVARIADGRLLLDPRTLRDDEVEVVASAVATARLRIRGGGPG
jgi:L-seryl-tRNA(Ser) seleniumtransferase